MRNIPKLPLRFIFRTESAVMRKYWYIADLVGKSGEAEEYIADFKARALDIKRKSGESWVTGQYPLWRYGLSNLYTMGSHFARGGSILDMWELKAPEAVQADMVDGDTQYQVVSLEALPEYTGDFILYGVWQIRTVPLWRIPSFGTPGGRAGGKSAPLSAGVLHAQESITYNTQLDIFIDFFRGFEGK